jgi:predicted DNA-binding transcriptional regulator YafY
VNRTDRLYALVEELRAVAPRPRSARWLAERFDVSSRTIERDLSALQHSGVPIWAEPGRTGGYCLDADHTLAPLGFSVEEALAMSVALGMLAQSPFRGAAISALRKVVAVMDERGIQETAVLAARIHLLEDEAAAEPPIDLLAAVRSGEALHIAYRDKNGVETSRVVEPIGFVGRGRDWYLIAWCRLRCAVRAFHGDRIVSAERTGEHPPRRDIRPDELDIVYGQLRTVTIRETGR